MGKHRLGYEPRNQYQLDAPTSSGQAEGNIQHVVRRDGLGHPGSETPCMCGNTLLESGRPPNLPTVKDDVGRRGKPKGIADDEQAGGVGQARSIEEATEQSWATSGGGRGEKGPGQGEFAAARHA